MVAPLATQTAAYAGATGELPVTIVAGGPVRILGALALANRYGNITCVKFRNDGNVAATDVQFEWTGFDQSGKSVAHFVLDRRGTFAPGVLIYGPTSTRERLGGDAHKNCTWSRRGDEASAFHNATSLRVHVESVTFSDGTTWKNPSPAP
jgi:hypothetical protein